MHSHTSSVSDKPVFNGLRLNEDSPVKDFNRGVVKVYTKKCRKIRVSCDSLKENGNYEQQSSSGK